MRLATVRSSRIFNEPQYASRPRETILFLTVKEKKTGVVCDSVGGDGESSLLRVKISTVGARRQIGAHTLQRAWWDGFCRTFTKRHATPADGGERGARAGSSIAPEVVSEVVMRTVMFRGFLTPPAGKNLGLPSAPPRLLQQDAGPVRDKVRGTSCPRSSTMTRLAGRLARGRH